MNFYAGSLDYEPAEPTTLESVNLGVELCDLEDKTCIEEINEFVNKPGNLKELCNLEDEVCKEGIDDFINNPENLGELNEEPIQLVQEGTD